MNNIIFAWTDERRALAKLMWQGGDTASAIAKELGDGLTRAAVMGIIHRNGWQHRILGEHHSEAGTRKSRQKDKPRGDRAMKISPPLQPQPIIVQTDNVIPVGQRKTLMELDADSCRWPIGQPGHADFFFCGGDAGEIIDKAGMKKRLPYCVFHCRIAYQPSGPRSGYIPMRKSR